MDKSAVIPAIIAFVAQILSLIHIFSSRVYSIISRRLSDRVGR